MKIQLASDLHLELLENKFAKFHGLERTDADVLLLPGDIHRDLQAAWVFAEWPVPVLYVHGNHEPYNQDIGHVRANSEKLLGHQAIVHNYVDGKLWTSAPRVRYLEETELIIDGVRFLGCTLWTDYALIHPDMVKQCMDLADRGIKDHTRISTGGRSFSARDARACHIRNLAWLTTKLTEPFDGKTVVMTHHGPHFKSTHPRYAGDLLNAAFVSNLEDLILRFQPDLWVHGHVHDSFDYMVGNTRVIANPRGYAKNRGAAQYPYELMFENESFNPALVISI